MKIQMLTLTAMVVVLTSCAGNPDTAAYGERRIADVNPVEIGKVGVGTKTLFNRGVKQGEAVVVFGPRTNDAVLQCNVDMFKVKIHLPETARLAFIEAVAKYRKDFDARTLNVRAKRTGDVYGKSISKVEWGTFTYNGHAEPKVRYGYVFIDRKIPYFTLTMNEAPNLGVTTDQVSVDDKSPLVILYFTKNQATELAEMLVQEKLEGILKERGIRDYSEEPDEYVPLERND